MSSEYVVFRDGAYRIGETRVALGPLVAEFWRGSPPEAIARCFPVLSLEQVYGAIAYYLAHRDEVDAVLDREHVEYDLRRAASREDDPTFFERFESARKGVSGSR